MRLHVKRESDLVLPLTIRGDFIVDVRRLTSRQTEELFNRCQKPNIRRGPGEPDTVLDDAKWLAAAPDAYIAGWQGLTAQVLRELGIDLNEEPPTANGTGHIAYDVELARDVWREAQALKFSIPIVQFSRDMLQAVEREKKSAFPPFVGSSSG